MELGRREGRHNYLKSSKLVVSGQSKKSNIGKKDKYFVSNGSLFPGFTSSSVCLDLSSTS